MNPAVFVTKLLQQSRFNTMTDSLLARIDDMGEKIDELERRYALFTLQPRLIQCKFDYFIR